ncbi:paralemmin-2 [Anoplopoma fimbria]|uniref:paralemmin-2 n=1 Tax=Anoplopoma fimbria TaxID=229290 RepID=UPI0023EB40FE|nr:paralemmin-2 [Anoplopoma fimbria]
MHTEVPTPVTLLPPAGRLTGYQNFLGKNGKSFSPNSSHTQCSKQKYMKKQGTGNTGASTPLSSPPGASSVQVYHDYQSLASKMYSGNGHAKENGSHTRRDRVTSRDGTGKLSSVPDIIYNSQDQRYSMKDESALRNSTWMMDSSSQAYSGPEDNSTDPHETLTETSTLTFVDVHNLEESAENHSLHGVEMVYLKEFVLIDDDDDGDMSLREKTVTDLSVMDGKAADLVCGRLLSTSSGSVSEYKEEFAAPEAPPPEDVEAAHEKKRCCFCTIL